MSGWTEPPLPPSGIPGVRRGQVLAPGHPAWQRWHDERVWGTMAGFGRHNPFFGDHDPEASQQWQEGDTHRYLSTLGRYNPELYGRAHQGMAAGLRRVRTAIAISTPALHRVLDDGRIKSGFETGRNFKGDLEGNGRYLSLRRNQEHEHFGYPHDHPDEGRPVYGYLTDDVFKDRDASQYGQHSLVLSPALHHRTTWSADDSLDAANELRPSPRTAPHLHSVPRIMMNPREKDLGLRQLVGDHTWRGGVYMEAQIHGGLPLHHTHYAILRSPYVGGSTHQANTELEPRLTERGIPWIHIAGRPDSGPAQAVAWDHGNPRRRLGALMKIHNAVATGAFAAAHNPGISWQQGPDRYLIELTAPGRGGLPMGQVADVEWGILYDPAPVDSILSRGYWQRCTHPVAAEDILARVRPQ